MENQRLLDRLLIPETLVKMYWAFDTRRPEVLAAEVFASKLRLDFTALFGGCVQELSNQELVAYWMKLKDYTTVAQHSLSGILPLFSQATSAKDGSSELVPVFANVMVYLRREANGKETKETRCDATLDLELVKRGDSAGDNPWRLASLKANVVKQVKYQEFWSDMDPDN